MAHWSNFYMAIVTDILSTALGGTQPPVTPYLGGCMLLNFMGTHIQRPKDMHMTKLMKQILKQKQFKRKCVRY